MNINTRNIQMHDGIGFWMNKDRSRSAEFLGRVFTFVKTPAGWVGDGQQFRTLDQAAMYIWNSH